MTGVKDFDLAMDNGVRGGELITISGQSGHGKTSFALWLTKQIANSGVPILWFTYEMNPWYLKEKFVKMGVDLTNLPVYVPIQHSENTINWIKNKILETIERYASKVIFIDHLHYLIPPEQEMNISLLIGGIVRKLKNLAVETDTVIYLIAHMRKLSMGEKVDINAVRDSGLIVNESDYVYLVERLKRKEKKGKLEEENPFFEQETNIAKIQLSKNRRTGRLFFRLFRVEEQNFSEVESEEYSQYV